MPEEDVELLLSLLARRIQPSPWGAETMSLNHGLHFTGGEPFLNYPLLLKAVEVAEELGIPSTFVETNCFWCKNDDVTREKLTGLKKAGLKGILISVNPFYAEYVPFKRTDRCIQISREVFGANVMVYQLEYYHRLKALGIQDRTTLDTYVKLNQGEKLAERVELFLQGRAARQLRALYRTHPAQAFFGEPCRPPFLRDWHNHFDNYGNFVAGYCGGISLGHWKDLEELLNVGIDLNEHPVLRFLVAEDVKGLLDFAKDLGYRETPGGYLSKCDLCLDLREYLVSRGNFTELSPKEFYTHLG
jgi:organic radical activating enzyme